MEKGIVANVNSKHDEDDDTLKDKPLEVKNTEKLTTITVSGLKATAKSLKIGPTRFEDVDY